MNSLLEQFISESREALQEIAEKLMQLEKEPESATVINELFRIVHTLKGNSGLFEFPELTRVLHAGEDLMDAVREGKVAFSLQLADLLLDAMDFVGMLCDEIERDGSYRASHSDNALLLADTLRRMKGEVTATVYTAAPSADAGAASVQPKAEAALQPANERSLLSRLPEQNRDEAQRLVEAGTALQLLIYRPAEECFFQGDDPFFQARQTPGLIWGGVAARKEWPGLEELDAYNCLLDFHVLSQASAEELKEYYRYVADQLTMLPVTAADLAAAAGSPGKDQQTTRAMPRRKKGAGAGNGAAPLDPKVDAAAAVIMAVQQEILTLPDEVAWIAGRLRAAAASLEGCLRVTGSDGALPGLQAAADAGVEQLSAGPLRSWLETFTSKTAGELFRPAGAPPLPSSSTESAAAAAPAFTPAAQGHPLAAGEAPSEPDTKFGRRAEDQQGALRSIKVDQEKIDRLMNLIGEMVVAKNALPYLAGRAEAVFGSRELSREIKAQYAVINRIVEEMQDSIMQVRMMPVSFVFQRFPRLVRDTSNRLGKKVNLVLEGEETEADKNIIESLGDPLVHIVRNSLDHGIEAPEVRTAAGKPAAGTLVIRASQETDRAVIEIRDDGKGIDPEIIKKKALEKGLIDQAHLERISDQEAVNLVFAAGFSTAEKVSDLSGRGVGMDVVRTAIEKVNGTVELESEKGKGTVIRISLPLSMAVTNVMIVESDGRIFGVPMDSVRETVRVPRSGIRTIKKNLATTLRGRIVPLKPLNALLGLAAEQKANDEGELAVLVVDVAGEPLGIMVDQFHETVDIILKPMTGVLAGLGAYAGSALLGDGSVLMVLNIKEVI